MEKKTQGQEMRTLNLAIASTARCSALSWQVEYTERLIKKAVHIIEREEGLVEVGLEGHVYVSMCRVVGNLW